MSSEWVSSRLIASIKRRALLPTADETYAASDYLAMADEETRAYCVPLLKQINEEFLVRRSDVTLDGSESYALPLHCAAEALRAVLLSTSTPSRFVPLDRCSPENAASVSGFYLQDDRVYLTPGNSFTGTLRFLYYLRPNRLVDEDNAVALSVDPSSTTLTFAATTVAALDAVGLAVGASLDIISARPGFRTLQLDNVITASSTTTLTVTTAAPSVVAVGDYAILSGTTPVPQLPAEMHPLLAQRVAVKLLEGKNDTGYAAALAECDRMEARCRSLLSHRTNGNPIRLQNYNAPGWGNNAWRRYPP